jgi:cell division protein FtsA
MTKMRQNLITALDIGTSKICCFIASLDEQQNIKVHGVGHHAAHGVKSGSIVDMEETVKSISNAVHDAEQLANETIKDVIVNISGGRPTSKMIEAEFPIHGREIDENDIKHVLEVGRSQPDSNDRTLIHSIPIDYSIDGSGGIKDPCGMFGQSLQANIHAITSSASSIRNLATCISRGHLDISAAVLSSYASGLACLAEDEMELGVTIIDLGAGTTKVAIFSEGNLIFSDSLMVGGNHITNDIARGLGTPVNHAERLKTLHGHALAASFDENVVLDVPQIGEDQYSTTGPISKSILVGIIQPRIEETFELVRKKLEASGFDKASGRHVVLTGGGSQMPGIRDLAAMILNKQVRLGRPNGFAGINHNETGPSFATASGLLLYAAQNKNIWGRNHNEMAQIPKGFFGKIRNWFNSNTARN